MNDRQVLKPILSGGDDDKFQVKKNTKNPSQKSICKGNYNLFGINLRFKR